MTPQCYNFSTSEQVVYIPLRHYELVVVLSPMLNQEQQTGAWGRIKDFINTRNADITYEEQWGTRRLAYPIRKGSHQFLEGSYHLTRFSVETPINRELHTFLRLDDQVLRSLVVTALPPGIEPETPAQKRAAAAVVATAAAAAAEARAAATAAELAANPPPEEPAADGADTEEPTAEAPAAEPEAVVAEEPAAETQAAAPDVVAEELVAEASAAEPEAAAEPEEEAETEA
ncbi:MAG TPA: 30S ribosomal protein S6 [Dehalococcoidia bacterium]|nr:30S ribosomal protein S6 [Dehalococcoidia bacterium]